jgi:hypothetical protein
MSQVVRERGDLFVAQGISRIHSALFTLLESNHGHHGIENHVSDAVSAGADYLPKPSRLLNY